MVARLERKAARKRLAADQIPPECAPPLFTSIKLIPPQNKHHSNKQPQTTGALRREWCCRRSGLRRQSVGKPNK